MCYSCGSELRPIEPVSRNETCPKCSRYVRCCMNCEFYSPGASNDCREPQSEPVADKEGANFCDYYRPAKNKKGGSLKSGAEDAKKRFDELFKK